jgi:hypothetical protein
VRLSNNGYEIAGTIAEAGHAVYSGT